MTITEANAVLALLDWLAGKPNSAGRVITAGEAASHLELLADRAGKALQVAPDRSIPARIVERLAAADSDGAAQAVCRAMEAHTTHGGSIPWPSVAKPLAAWRAAQDGQLARRLRDQTAADA